MMYSVVIADDENWIIEGLKRSINWEELGYKVTGQANDGLDAYKMVSLTTPDVAFIDIRMPGMNGLELIKKTRQDGLDINFVVISGYAEFEYAKKALDYGAAGYCLKPFNESEIQSLLCKIKESLERKELLREIELPELFESTEEDDPVKFDALKNILAQHGIDMRTGKKLFVVVTAGEGILMFPEGTNYISFKVGFNKRAYLMQYTNDSYIYSAVEAGLNCKAAKKIKGAGLSTISADSIESFRKPIEDASIAAYQFFVTGERKIFNTADMDLEGMEDIYKAFNELIKNTDIPSIERGFVTLSNILKSRTIKQAYHVYNMTLMHLYEKNTSLGEDILLNFEQLTDCFSHITDMISYVKELFVKVFCLKPDYLTKPIKSDTLRPVKQYIDDNFFKNISIQDLSARFSINPSYISILFKKETGKTFTEYLTELRINYSCKLLAGSDMPISSIAEKSGHNDYFYFCKVFKKHNNCTPTQYRKKCKGVKIIPSL